MARRLLTLAVPLALLVALPAAQVLAERVFIARSAAGPAAIPVHALLLGSATILFLFLNGPNVYALVSISRLIHEGGRPDDVTRYAQNVIGFSDFGTALCYFLVPFSSPVAVLLLGRAPCLDEVQCVMFLLATIPGLLALHAALAPTLASGRAWSAVIVIGAGLFLHAAFLVVTPYAWGLAGATVTRAVAAAVCSWLADSLLRTPKRNRGRSTIRRHDKVIQLELLRRGSVVGFHAVASSLVVGFLFLFAMSRTGDGAFAASAISFGVYGFLAALPVGVAQAGGLLASVASANRDTADLQNIITSSHRIGGMIACAIAAGFFIAGCLVFWRSGADPEADLAVALIGISVHAGIEWLALVRVWSLRALDRQNQILQATIAAGALFITTAFLVPTPASCWLALALYDLVLGALLSMILARSIPAEDPSRER